MQYQKVVSKPGQSQGLEFTLEEQYSANEEIIVVIIFLEDYAIDNQKDWLTRQQEQFASLMPFTDPSNHQMKQQHNHWQMNRTLPTKWHDGLVASNKIEHDKFICIFLNNSNLVWCCPM